MRLFPKFSTFKVGSEREGSVNWGNRFSQEKVQTTVTCICLEDVKRVGRHTPQNKNVVLFSYKLPAHIVPHQRSFAFRAVSIQNTGR